MDPALRTDVLIRAIRKGLEKYRHDIDADRELRSITVMVKLNGGLFVRAVIVTRESTAEEVDGAADANGLTARRSPG